MGLTEGDPEPQSSHKLKFLQDLRARTTKMKRTATAITQNPYIDLVDSDEDDEDDNQPDVRIFQAPPGYPLYLQPKDEVKARNGYIFTKFDNERQQLFLRKTSTNERQLCYVW